MDSNDKNKAEARACLISVLGCLTPDEEDRFWRESGLFPPVADELEGLVDQAGQVGAG